MINEVKKAINWANKNLGGLRGKDAFFEIKEDSKEPDGFTWAGTDGHLYTRFDKNTIGHVYCWCLKKNEV